MPLSPKSIYVIQRSSDNLTWEEKYISGSNILIGTDANGTLVDIPIASIINSKLEIANVAPTDVSASIQSFNFDSLGEFISLKSTTTIKANGKFPVGMQSVAGLTATVYYTSTDIEATAPSITLSIYPTGNSSVHNSQQFTLPTTPINTIISQSIAIQSATFNGCTTSSYYTLEINNLTPAITSDIRFRLLKIEK